MFKVLINVERILKPVYIRHAECRWGSRYWKDTIRVGYVTSRAPDIIFSPSIISSAA